MSFPLGVLYSLFEDDFKFNEKLGKVIHFTLLAAGLFLSIGLFRYSYLIGNLAANILAIAVIWGAARLRKNEIVSKVLMKLGELSLYIYLIEGFFMFNEFKVFDIFGYSYIGLFISIIFISIVACGYRCILRKALQLRK